MPCSLTILGENVLLHEWYLLSGAGGENLVKGIPRDSYTIKYLRRMRHKAVYMYVVGSKTIGEWLIRFQLKLIVTHDHIGGEFRVFLCQCGKVSAVVSLLRGPGASESAGSMMVTVPGLGSSCRWLPNRMAAWSGHTT